MKQIDEEDNNSFNITLKNKTSSVDGHSDLSNSDIVHEDQTIDIAGVSQEANKRNTLQVGSGLVV